MEQRMTQQRRRPALRRRRYRGLTLILCAALTAAVVPCGAAELTGNVVPSCDEAYYATLDYYGNLSEASIVKSYIMNGASRLTDYGQYDEVVNLTDGTQPVTRDGVTTFDFGGRTPDHFYFEGKTAEPFASLPWTLALSYRLNGVPKKAEELAGQTGVVDICLDLVPNPDAGEYAKNNYTLESMAVFNQDDILSLEAEGGQVQLIGNLRLVLFVCLPGEEQHVTIRVGTDDFAFAGMTFLMVPATLSQLNQISELSQRRDTLEEDYDKLSSSLDTLLDAFGDMSGSLYATANGLDELNSARGTLSAGKGAVYDGTDKLRGDLTDIAGLLDPVAQQVQSASQTLSDAKTAVNTLTDTAVSLQKELKELESTLEDLEDSDDVRDLIAQAAGMKSSLNTLKNALNSLGASSGSSGSGVKVSQMPETVQSLHSAFQAADGAAALAPFGSAADGALDLNEFIVAMTLISAKPATPEEQQAALAAASNIIAALAADDTGNPYYAKGAQLKGLYEKAGGSLDFGGLCYAVLLSQGQREEDAQELAGLMVKLYSVMESAGSDAAAQAQLDLILSSIDKILGDLDSTASGVGSALSGVSGPTAAVVGRLADLCGELDSLSELLDSADNLSSALRSSSKKCRDILDQVKALQDILNDYEPQAQESLKTLEELSVSAAATVRDTESLVSDAESLLKSSGAQLDSGTQKTLSGLAASLRQAAKGLSATNDVKSAKQDISSIIEDTWNEHTGDLDNLLNMDPEAEMVSLTSARNAAPSSVQVLIRTQEIQAAEAEDTEEARVQTDNGTFWSRLGRMFGDFWGAVTGIFH